MFYLCLGLSTVQVRTKEYFHSTDRLGILFGQASLHFLTTPTLNSGRSICKDKCRETLVI